MYVDILRERLLEQAKVYQSFKNHDRSLVCYQEKRDENFGRQDANYLNRMRLSYYLFYEKIEDEEGIAALFEEELKDRETNDFQGIGDTLSILTCLLRKYNHNGKYEELFRRAKNANFDCACGYDVNIQIEEDIYQYSLLDCLELAYEMEYKDVLEVLLEEWKNTIEDWKEFEIRRLIRFNQYLGREPENEEWHKRLFFLKLKKEANGKINPIASAYKDMIGYYLDSGKYELAYQYLDELLKNYDLRGIKHIRLYEYFLEQGAEIICHMPSAAKPLWSWLKQEVQKKEELFGNLYEKSIAAAKTMQDPLAEKLEADYAAWKQKFNLT